VKDSRKIAITGGIGVGKSYVCSLLNVRGIHVYDCDAAAKRLIAQSESLQAKINVLLGKNVFVDGIFNKQELAQFILKSDANRIAVNNIIHPAVAEDFMNSGYDWLESAILFDSGFDKRISFDKIICVTAPNEVRVSRIMQRDHISREMALEWINKQLPNEKVLSMSDFEIVNDGISNIEEQIDRILSIIK
jgi:dephospho-CoA kinase